MPSTWRGSELRTSSPPSAHETDDGDFKPSGGATRETSALAKPPASKPNAISSTSKRKASVLSKLEPEPAKKRRHEPSPEKVAVVDRAWIASTRGQCIAIHHIDNSYSQQDIVPRSSVQVGRELHQGGGMLTYDRRTQKLKKRDVRGCCQVISKLVSESCEPGTTFEDFCKDPKKVLGDDFLRTIGYNEYCASVEQSLGSDEDAVVTPSSSDADIDRPTSQDSDAASPPIPKLDRVRLNDGSHKDMNGRPMAASRQQGSEQSIEIPDSPPHPLSSSRMTDAPSAALHDGTQRRDTGGVRQPVTDQLHSNAAELPSPIPWTFDEVPGSLMSGRTDQRLPRASHQKMDIQSEAEQIEIENSQRTENEVGRIESEVRQRVASEVKRVEREAKEQIEREVEKRMRAAAPPVASLSYIMPNATDYHLDTGMLTQGFQAMFSQSKSRIWQAFAARGIPTNGPASFMVYPLPSLEELYGLVTGVPRAGHNSKSAIVSGISAAELALSLFGAFLVRVVFDASLGETFDEYQTKFGDTAVEVDQVLQEFQTNRDTVLRKAYLRRLLNKDWVESKFRRMAEMLSEDFAVRLEQHLGIQHGDNGLTYGPSMYALANRFSMMIFDALVLKCKLSSARERISVMWYYSGDGTDSDVMETSAEEHTRVVLTLFPGLAIAGPNFEVVFKAQVESSE